MFRLIKRREGGQVLLMGALLLPVLLGMTALAVDIGGYAMERRDLQNAADSMALAAAQELPDQTDATAAAAAWATKNNVAAGEYTLTFTAYAGGSSYPQVRVQINRNHDFTFARAVGVDSKDNHAAASGIKASYGGSSGIVPWSVTQSTVDLAPNGGLVTMKYDANNVDTGNFGAIRVDGPGSATYNTSVRYGSTTVACAVTAPNCVAGACPGTYPSTCSENAPECDGPDCTPQTGNLVGPTRTGTDFRMNNTSATCDSFDEAFSGPTDGKYNLNPDCNPWLDGPGKCQTLTSLCSRRVIIIPVVDEFGSGASDPTVLQRFALIYLEGYDAGKCDGNTCEINGRFVTADMSANALAGFYDPGATVHFARLSE